MMLLFLSPSSSVGWLYGDLGNGDMAFECRGVAMAEGRVNGGWGVGVVVHAGCSSAGVIRSDKKGLHGMVSTLMSCKEWLSEGRYTASDCPGAATIFIM